MFSRMPFPECFPNGIKPAATAQPTLQLDMLSLSLIAPGPDCLQRVDVPMQTGCEGTTKPLADAFVVETNSGLVKTAKGGKSMKRSGLRCIDLKKRSPVRVLIIAGCSRDGRDAVAAFRNGVDWAA